MGSSQSSVLGSVNEDVVERLNQFGGQELPLFGSTEEHGNRRRLLVVCEGVDSKASTLWEVANTITKMI